MHYGEKRDLAGLRVLGLGGSGEFRAMACCRKTELRDRCETASRDTEQWAAVGGRNDHRNYGLWAVRSVDCGQRDRWIAGHRIEVKLEVVTLAISESSVEWVLMSETLARFAGEHIMMEKAWCGNWIL